MQCHTVIAMSLECQLANVMPESYHWLWKHDRNSGCSFCMIVGLNFRQIIHVLIYTHNQELMKSVGSHGSS
jgi:hypothetical protein